MLKEGITITDNLLKERYPSFAEFKSRKGVRYFAKPDLEQEIEESAADNSLIESIQGVPSLLDSHEVTESGVIKGKGEPITIAGRQVYPRNRNTAINALSRADYSCEINPAHITFKRRTMDCQYTEPHHLIPMAYQDQFDVSLDVEENIVSLCCTCHKEIHYGADAESLVKQLFKKRKDQLKSVGIVIGLKQLMQMYD